MELIPILSTIILVATISTFFLAIGAYILYKIRESKGQQAVIPAQSKIKGELYTPVEAPAEPQPVYMEHPSIQYQPSTEPVFNPVPQYTFQPGQFPEPAFSEVKNYNDSKEKPASKYLKYTSEGYIPAGSKNKEEKTSGTLKWN